MKKRKGGFMNEILEVTELIIGYEDEGLFSSEDIVLMISDCKFHFRDRITGELETIEYAYIDRKFDNVEYTDDELETMELCVAKAIEHGFYVG